VYSAISQRTTGGLHNLYLGRTRKKDEADKEIPVVDY